MAEDLRDQYYLIKMVPRPKVTKKKETEVPKQPTAEENLDLGGEEDEKTEEKEESADEPNPEHQQAPETNE